MGDISGGSDGAGRAEMPFEFGPKNSTTRAEHRVASGNLFLPGLRNPVADSQSAQGEPM